MSGTNSRTNFLPARIQIGNSKGPIDYKQSQTVFHHDDVPEHKRTRKEEVKEYARRKILDETPSWNQSSNPQRPLVERRSMENHVHDRSRQFQYNYRAESLDCLRNVEPVEKSSKFHISMQLESTAQEIMRVKAENPVQRGRLHRTQEMPVHPRLDDTPAWNNTTVLTEKEVKQALEKKTQHARQWTATVSKTLPARKEYLSPMQATIQFGEKVRQRKFEGTFSAKELLNPPPLPDEERYEKRNRNLIEGMRKKKVHMHSGVWETNKIDGRSMWSDTGSYVYNSKGDIVQSVNLDRSNNVDAVKNSRREEHSTTRPPPLHYSAGRALAKTSSREFDTGNNSITLTKMFRAESA